ncbi:beta-aspartyl-peptidase [Pseudoalteromonas prydzensis]|uniref:beta-aspartyl-peptidase n=1 Tax=Pseudoalteromonas prydzensis TaxID=182141 RepID=UPI0007E52290|nr:beta-aspartyl-peptidase [Pseudoalteromonas prydzensis]MBE0380172.1 beta-aspartyl-dipeptidase (metallo-type) [Pseudoalteromonas prydzensis ACAM 620]
MLTLIRGASLYTPSPLGKMDVLIAGTKVIDFQPHIKLDSNINVKQIDATGYILTPGFVDSLVHITGGGGEASFASRTPEMNLTDATLHGITCVVAALGTDSSSRTLTNLVAKAKGLKELGLNVFCHTGSYHLPAKTLTGSVTNDIMYIEEFIGVGEVAISDHRSSQPTVQQLAELAAEAKVAGMLSGKKGIISIHVGPIDSHLTILHEVGNSTDIALSQFYPTHMNRNKALLDAGIDFCKAGGSIDFTTSTTEYDLAHGEYAAASALAYCLEHGVDATKLTMSSDGHASLPIFDDSFNLLGLEVGKEASLHTSFMQAVHEYGVSIEHALMAITSNPAQVLGLNKGTIRIQGDADLVLLDEKTLSTKHVWSNGKLMVEQGEAIVKGPFE